MRWSLVIFVVLCSLVNAASLKSVSRGDIHLDPYKFGLQGDLRRTLAEYRKAVNQANIDVGQDRQIRAEQERMRQLLKSRGYYQASISSEWDEQAGKPIYNVQLGRQFKIVSVSLKGNYQPVDDKWLKLKVGKPLTAESVLAQQTTLKKNVEKEACFFEQKISHEVTLNEADGTGDVTFIVKLEKPATFGAVSFTGIGRINEPFLNKVTGIERGVCYKRATIDSAVFSLFDTGLFRQVRPSFELNEQGQVDVLFTTKRREKRTISAGIGYKSEQGPATKLGWQHRDLFGMAQKLTLETEWQKTEQTYSADLEIPSFFDRRNRLSLENEFVYSNKDDIRSKEYSTAAVLERTASWKDYYEYGIGYKRTDEKVEDQWKVYHQLRFPLLYRYDTVTNPFNPNGGGRFTVSVEPVLDIEDALTPYIKTSLGLQLFIADRNSITLASRLQWDSLWYGSVLGSSLANVPNSELYSAGGSNSIRGYDYQSIKLADNPQVGGSDRWLLVNELRMPLSDSWGAVGFWDTGAVSNVADPLRQDVWYSGFGFGVRYYTRFAPIRLDVAFPVDSDVQDRNFHIYFSLGQAF